MMSQYNPTLSILGIADTNIHVSDVRNGYRGKDKRCRKVHIIVAKLAYAPHVVLCVKWTLCVPMALRHLISAYKVPRYSNSH